MRRTTLSLCQTAS